MAYQGLYCKHVSYSQSFILCSLKLNNPICLELWVPALSSEKILFLKKFITNILQEVIRWKRRKDQYWTKNVPDTGFKCYKREEKNETVKLL